MNLKDQLTMADITASNLRARVKELEGQVVSQCDETVRWLDRVKELEGDAKIDEACQKTITEELGKEIKRLRDALEGLLCEVRVAPRDFLRHLIEQALRSKPTERDAKQ